MEKTILLIGEHEAVRSALAKRLEMAFPRTQVIEAAAEEAVALLESRSPCVVVIDIGPPAGERLEVVRHIKTVQPAAQIVVWSVHEWETYRADALAAGATAYVLKEEAQENLLSVLKAMLSVEFDALPRHPKEEGGKTITTL
jgi:DNA-binding NarL/FixJ family response regulator